MKNPVTYIWRQAEIQVVANKLARLERKERDLTARAKTETPQTTGYDAMYLRTYPAVDLGGLEQKITEKYSPLEKTRIENSAKAQVKVMDVQEKTVKWTKKKWNEFVTSFRPRI